MKFSQHFFRTGDFLSRTGDWFSEWVQTLADVETDLDAESATIEFIGGPLDGHCETVIGEKVFQLPTVLEYDPDADAFASLERPGGAPPRRIIADGGRTSFYDLRQRDCRWFYQFSHRQAVATDR